MASVTYPANLPTFEGRPTETFQDTVIRTPMSQGAAKMRRRFSEGSSYLSLHLTMTSAQRLAFLTFWRTQTGEGSIAFDMQDPNSDTMAEFRFTSPPRFQHLRGDGRSTDLYRLTIDLEKLP